jgi:hypothetical protein
MRRPAAKLAATAKANVAGIASVRPVTEATTCPSGSTGVDAGVGVTKSDLFVTATAPFVSAGELISAPDGYVSSCRHGT